MPHHHRPRLDDDRLPRRERSPKLRYRDRSPREDFPTHDPDNGPPCYRLERQGSREAARSTHATATRTSPTHMSSAANHQSQSRQSSVSPANADKTKALTPPTQDRTSTPPVLSSLAKVTNLGTDEPQQEDSAEGSASSINETPSKDPNTLSEPLTQCEDVKTYGQLIRKVASALGLPVAEQRAQVEDMVLNVLHRDSSAPHSLPLSSVTHQAIQTAWKNPASAPTSNKKLDHMYRVQESSASFLYTHPKPNSLIVSSAARGHRHHSTPQDR